MAETSRNRRQNSEFLKDLEDRVRADPEMVGHVLDPNRTTETVRFPDPSARPPSATDSGIPRSIAEFEMARRTDAGPRLPASINKRNTVLWLVVAAALIALVSLLAFVWTA
jgi:hypothetical protein